MSASRRVLGGAGVLAVLGGLLTLGPGGSALADSLAPGVSLPRVGTIGDLPPEAERVVVVADAEGNLRVKGADLDLAGLTALLQRVARDPRRTQPDGSSRWNLVLAADATLPWGVVARVLLAAADPRVRMHRLFFAVLPERGEEEGGLATFLPGEREIRPPPTPGADAAAPASVRVAMGGGSSDPSLLFAALRARPGEVAGRRFEVAAEDLAPTGFVLRVVDVLFRAGAAGVDFASPAGDRSAGALRELVEEATRDPRTPGIRVQGVDLAAVAPSPLPPRERLRGQYAGDAGERNGTLRPSGHEEALPDKAEPAAEDLPFEEEPGPGDGIADAPFDGPTELRAAFRRRGRGAPATSPEDQAVRTAVDQALRWLAAHQSPDGGWEARGFPQWCEGKPAGGQRPDGIGKPMYDPGVTGLALLAFLGAGYTHRGTHPFAKTVARGLRYLKGQQDAEGCIGPRTTQHYIYNHAIAALAVVEAYGMTGSPIHQPHAQKALDFIALARNPYFAWRYGVKPGDNDTSVTGWMASVLLTARAINRDAVAAGKPAPLGIDEEAFEGALAWVDKVTDPEYGRVGYLVRGSGPARPQELVDRFPPDRSESMTAIGVHLRLSLGQPATSAAVVRGLALLGRLLPTWNEEDGSIDMYYWFYGSLAAHGAGGEAWTAWNAALRNAARTQRQDTDPCAWKGSFDPKDPWGPDGGRVYATALMALSLETPWRAIPPER